MGPVVDVRFPDPCAPPSRRSPTRAMAALRHEHCRVLLEVKGKAVWIPTVLVDGIRHRWTNSNGGPKQRPSGLHSRKGKGRAAEVAILGHM